MEEALLAEEQADRTRNNVKECLDQCYKGLSTKDFVKARLSLNQLKEPEWKDYVDQEKVSSVEGVLRLAEGQLADKDDLIAIVKAWAVDQPEVCAEAYLQGYEKLRVERPVDLREARNHLRQKNLAKDLRERLDKVDQAEEDIQPRKSLQARRRVDPLPVTASPLIERALQMKKEPFPFLRAEDDQNLLFMEGKAYWPGHDLYQVLRRSEVPYLVYGASGSGRTAMALALGHYLSGDDQLTLYVPGGVTLAEIQTGFVQGLLDFLTAYPTFLARFGSAERSLLARVLGTGLGREFALAEIAVMISNIPKEKWLDEAKDPKQRQLWQTSSIRYLEALSDELQLLPGKLDSAPTWPREFCRCVRSFGFARARLIVDVTNDGNIGHAKTQLFSYLQQWAIEGLTCIVFMPARVSHKVHDRDRKGVNERWLIWDEKQLADMAVYRCKALVWKYTQLRGFFEKEAWAMLIKHSLVEDEGAPRRFFRLWNAITYSLPMDQTKVDIASVEKALQKDTRRGTTLS